MRSGYPRDRLVVGDSVSRLKKQSEAQLRGRYAWTPTLSVHPGEVLVPEQPRPFLGQKTVERVRTHVPEVHLIGAEQLPLRIASAQHGPILFGIICRFEPRSLPLPLFRPRL